MASSPGRLTILGPYHHHRAARSGRPSRRFGSVTRNPTDRAQTKEQFRLAIEAAPNGMIMVNESGTIVLVNTQTEKLFGYTRQELLGQKIEILVPDRLKHQHPSHRRNFLAEPRMRPMGGGRELFGLRKDGTEIPIEIG